MIEIVFYKQLIIEIIIGLLFYIIANYIFNYFLDKNKKITLVFLYNIIKLLYVVGFVFYILKQFPIFNDFSKTFLATSTIIVAAIGFALQSSLKNIIAGTLLSYSKTFQIGDRIRILSKNITGYIEDITLRHTVVRTFTNERVIIPNSVLADEIVVNNYLEEMETSYPLVFTIYPYDNIDKAIEIIKNVIKENEKTIKKDEIDVLCSDISLEGVSLKVFIWTKYIEENFKVASDVRLSILKQFKENNIQISFNKGYSFKERN